MHKEELFTSLDQVEKIASVSKIRRMFSNPSKYLRAILYRELVYKRTKKEKEVQAKTFFGSKMHLLLPSSTDIYLTGGKSHDSEIRLAKFLINNLQQTNTFFDVGAHYGYFSLLASSLVGQNGQVISFEASPKTFRILKKNNASCKNCKSHNVAVSDSTSNLVFYEFPNLYSEYNTLDVEQFKNESWFSASRPTETKVESITLDQFIKQEQIKPNIIKIDVEGAEFQVINGFKDYLEVNSPFLVMEYLSDLRGNEAHIDAEALLRSMGYDAFIIDRYGELKKIQEISSYLSLNEMESDNIVFKKG